MSEKTGRAPTDYEKFVNTEALLACQRPLDALVSSHELFFQVTHQVMELWMKVIHFELQVAIDEMGAATRTRRPRACAASTRSSACSSIRWR